MKIDGDVKLFVLLHVTTAKWSNILCKQLEELNNEQSVFSQKLREEPVSLSLWSNTDCEKSDGRMSWKWFSLFSSIVFENCSLNHCHSEKRVPCRGAHHNLIRKKEMKCSECRSRSRINIPALKHLRVDLRCTYVGKFIDLPTLRTYNLYYSRLIVKYKTNRKILLHLGSYSVSAIDISYPYLLSV